MVIRAAFDIGSGATKLVIARLSKTSPYSIQEILFSNEVEVLLSHDLLKSQVGAKNQNKFSSGITSKLYKTIAEMVLLCKKLGVEDKNMFGVCTHAFRMSANGEEVIQNLKAQFNLQVSVIEQSLEGELGFRTGLAALGLHQGCEPDLNDVIVWDTGGGSFQLSSLPNKSSNQDLYVVKGKIGSASVTEAAIRLQGKDFAKVQSANPFTERDEQNLRAWILDTLRPVSEKIRNDNILVSGAKPLLGIGGETCAFRIAALLAKQEYTRNSFEGPVTVHKSDLDSAINENFGKTDTYFAGLGVPQPEMVFPKVLLVSSVLQVLGIDAFTYHYTTGSCLGILSREEFWLHNSKSNDY